jgi:hypothetical protein
MAPLGCHLARSLTADALRAAGPVGVNSAGSVSVGSGGSQLSSGGLVLDSSVGTPGAGKESQNGEFGSKATPPRIANALAAAVLGSVAAVLL